MKIDKKPYEWVLHYKQPERQAASSYPGITTSAERQQHWDAQASLLYYLHRIWLDYFPGIIKAHSLQKYHDMTLEVNGEPCCIGMLCLEAIDKCSSRWKNVRFSSQYVYCQDDDVQWTFVSQWCSSPRVQSRTSDDDDRVTEWLELSDDQVYKVQEQALIRHVKDAINAYMLTATEI